MTWMLLVKRKISFPQRKLHEGCWMSEEVFESCEGSLLFSRLSSLISFVIHRPKENNLNIFHCLLCSRFWMKRHLAKIISLILNSISKGKKKRAQCRTVGSTRALRKSLDCDTGSLGSGLGTAVVAFGYFLSLTFSS